MFAYVLSGAVSKISADSHVTWGSRVGFNPYLMTKDERKAIGVYDFVAAPSIPEYYKYNGTTYIVDDVSGVVTENIDLMPMTPDEVRGILQDKVKNVRKTSLDHFVKCSAGMSIVYALNYEAALLGETDTTTILRNGLTPAQHLTLFGSKIGMTAEAFKNYILTENATLGATMTNVESEYLATYYLTISNPTSTVEQMVAAAKAYQEYCSTILGQ